MKNQKVLVGGASIAGLTTAWWLNHIGYQVTVVELATAPRTNGAAVDLNASTVEIARRMGLYDELKKHQLSVDQTEYKNAADVTEGTIVINGGSEPPADEIEIERDKFVQVLMAALTGKVEFLFNDRITEMQETPDKMLVTFKNQSPRAFHLVFGCDGSHSGTRKVWFGPEQDYAHFLGAYFSISIVPELLVKERTMQTYSVPCKSVMLNAYNGKTDIIFIFLSDNEIPYDYRDLIQQRQIIKEEFSDAGWRTAELLNDVLKSPGFYFDKFCQIKMPSWSKGRVALIGDAAYCPSPASGPGRFAGDPGCRCCGLCFTKIPGRTSKGICRIRTAIAPPH
jgi:2-polyprenyl-6-methoxyphenol hydroxylase-like FAD-dependent oxidoreductase